MTYKIVRHYANKRRRRVIARGLTLEQAQAHCSNPRTSGADWFDGYYQE